MSYPKKKLIELIKKVYRLTQLFPKKEPLRYKIREIADEILANLLKGLKNPTLKDWEVLDSFFEIAKEQNWVSPKEIFQIQQDYKNLFQGFHFEHKEGRPSINERQEKILEILKEKGKIQVGQVTEFFPNVSKRTLRRDFQKLVKKGIIERIGEKNKTFYQLKNG
jgi:predicted HTH transcriptional regulator